MPKKRGPKTDVLEALLKRVDGLEAQLKEKKTEEGGSSADGASDDAQPKAEEADSTDVQEPPAKRRAGEDNTSPTSNRAVPLLAPKPAEM